jgi:hypothetical protein
MADTPNGGQSEWTLGPVEVGERSQEVSSASKSNTLGCTGLLSPIGSRPLVDGRTVTAADR